LPDADIKIFLTASVEDRTRRRYEELAEKGTLTQTFEELKNELEYRDKNDSSRSIAPLKKAEDAILLDTTGFPLEKTVKMILDIVKARVNNAI
jgi:cytidylate kinase